MCLPAPVGGPYLAPRERGASPRDEGEHMEPQTEATDVAAPVVQVPTAMPMGHELSGGGIDTVGGAPIASSGRRLGAYCLEFVLMIVTLGIGWTIWSIVLWGQGQSPAKKVLGLRVVKLQTGKAATRGTMFLRE